MKKNELYDSRSWESLRKLIRVMKLSVCIILFSVFQLLAGNGFAQQQRLTLEFESSKVVDILSHIEKESDYAFLYNVDLVDVERRVNLSLKEAPINKVLNDLFDGSGVKYQIMDNQVIILSQGESLSQQSTSDISGKVVDSSGQPLPGVSIVIKGTTIGTITDFEGNFSLVEVPGNSTLVFSFVGMKTQEIVVAGQSIFSIVMEDDAIGIEEVVAIGYGSMVKKEVAGAVAQTSGEKLEMAPVASLTNSLPGRLPGLFTTQRTGQPGRDDATIVVRGYGTTGDNSALIVIDGVANRDGLSRLDPNDIESVTVLKDASAAIYGAQAANGVILVTTKRGKSGRPVFSYDVGHSFITPTMKPKVANAYQYATIINSSDEYAGRPLTFPEETLEQYKNGTLPSYDWYNGSFKKYSNQTKHNVSLRGGTETIKYFIGAGALMQDGLIKHDTETGNEQWNIRANIDIQLTKDLDIGVDLSQRHQKVSGHTHHLQWGVADAVLSVPTTPIYVDDDPRYPAVGRLQQNPLAVAQNDDYNRTYYDVTSVTFKYNYNIPGVKGLSVGGFSAIDINNAFNKTWLTPEIHYVKDATTGEITPRPNSRRNSGIPALSERFDKTKNTTHHFKVSYKNTFGNHTVDAFAAHERWKSRNDNFVGSIQEFLSRSIDQFAGGVQSNEKSSVRGNAFEGGRINYFGRVNYNYSGKYLLQLIARYDGSEKFPKGNRFGFFPAVQAGWIVSDEGFMKDNGVIDFLKLKGSWGELGNDRISSFQHISRFQFGNSYVDNGEVVNGLKESGTTNPSITWETTETINFGFEAMFLDSKLNWEFDVFRNNTRDMLAVPKLTIPNYAGIDIPVQNIGKMRNQGFEMKLAYRDAIGDFNFNVGGNIAFARNKVVFIDETPNSEAYQDQTGKPWNSPLVYKTNGIFRTQADLDSHVKRSSAKLGDFIIEDVNEDGVIDGNDRVRMDQNFNPEIQYGINLDVTYKNFDFSALFQGQARALKLISSHSWLFVGVNNGYALFEDIYSSKNIDAEYPRMGSETSADFWYRNGAYIRLKNVSLGYTLPKESLKKLGVSRLRLYVSANNILTFDSLGKYGITDPEQGGGVNNSLLGRTQVTSTLNSSAFHGTGWEYPITKSVNFGLNISF